MDQKEIGEWIDRQEYPLSAWLAWRAAMRVAPLTWKRPSMVEPKASNPHDDGTSGGILLALLFVEVGLGKPDVVDWVAQGMFAYTGSKIYAEYFKFDDGLDEASFASFAASHLALGHFRTSLDCAYKSVAGTIAESMFLEAMNSDVTAANEGRSLDSRALWPNGNPLSTAWDDALDRWSRLRPGWDFWIRWYEGTLSGKRLPFDVQEQMALIAPEIWDQGAEAVAAEIARIEEQFRLQHEVARLNEELAVARADIVALTNRGHNNPPELLQPVGEIERHANEIGSALNEAETELARAAPRAAVLNRVGRVLLSAAEKSLVYCASLGDAVLKKAAEELGSSGAKALVGAGLLEWVSHLEAVQELARALRAFAQMLGSG